MYDQSCFLTEYAPRLLLLLFLVYAFVRYDRLVLRQIIDHLPLRYEVTNSPRIMEKWKRSVLKKRPLGTKGPRRHVSGYRKSDKNPSSEIGWA